MDIDNYYTTLGLQKDADLPEIKKAYRTKAKLFHPDLNNLPDAKEKFIEVNEAYEGIINIKSGKYFIEPIKNKNYRTQKERERNWFEEEQENARKRAAYYSNLKYSDFKKTRIFKTTELLSSLSDYMFITLGILAPAGAIYGIITNGIYYLQNGEEKVNILAIVTTFMITLFGSSIIIFFVKAKRRS